MAARRSSKSGAMEDYTPITMELSEDERKFMLSEPNEKRISEIGACFVGGKSLDREGRLFIREGTLQKMCRKGFKPRHFFLFNDCVVYGSIVTKGRYKGQEFLPLNAMQIEPIEDSAEGSNGFQINHPSKSFVVYAPSVQDKANWLTGLNRFIDLSRAAMPLGDEGGVRAAWIPDKKVNTCMVPEGPGCKPKFTLTNRRHHCRNCGKLVCGPCSIYKAVLNKEKAERVCWNCWKLIGGVNPGDVPVLGKASTETEAAAAARDDDDDSDSDSDSDDDGVVGVVAGSSAATVNHDTHAAGDLSAGEKKIHQMSDADRIKIMTMVKEGKIDLQVAMAAIEQGKSLKSLLAEEKVAPGAGAAVAEGEPYAEALYANDDPEQADELVFAENDVIMLTRQVNDEWLEGYVKGSPEKRGIFPSAFVEVKIPVPQ